MLFISDAKIYFYGNLQNYFAGNLVALMLNV